MMNKIHFFWDNLETIPSEYLTNINICKINNYNFTVELWDDKKAKNLILNKYQTAYELYSKLLPPAAKADLFRLICLYTHGGWYLDCDLRVNQNLSFLDEGKDDIFFIRDDEDNRITNMAFYTKKENKKIKNIIDTIISYYENGLFNNDVWSLTGPGVYNVFYHDFETKLSFIKFFKSGLISTFKSIHTNTSTTWSFQQDFGVYNFCPKLKDYQNPRKLDKAISYLKKIKEEEYITPLLNEQSNLEGINIDSYADHINIETKVIYALTNHHNINFYINALDLDENQKHEMKNIVDKNNEQSANVYKDLAILHNQKDNKIAYELMLIASFFKKGDFIMERLSSWAKK